MSGQLRILIVRVGAMGDVLHALPAVAGLRTAMPEAEIGWAIEPRWMALLRAADGAGGKASMPLVDRVHAVATKEWRRRPYAAATLREIAGLRRAMRAERYDVCVDLQGTLKSAVVGWISGAQRRVGLAEPREWAARRLYDQRVPVLEGNVIGQACDLLGVAVGLWVPTSHGVLAPMAGSMRGYTRETGLRPKEVVVPRDVAAEGWAERLMGGDEVALLAPTAGWGAKEWGVERFAGLARGLRERGLRVLVNGVPGASGDTAGRVAEMAGAEVVRSSLPELMALTRRAALVVGGDSGPMHLAAALGRPTVALFGPTDPARNGPAFVGARVRVLRHAESVTSYKRLGETERGLARITVEEVMAAGMELLGAPGTGEEESGEKRMGLHE